MPRERSSQHLAVTMVLVLWIFILMDGFCYPGGARQPAETDLIDRRRAARVGGVAVRRGGPGRTRSEDGSREQWAECESECPLCKRYVRTMRACGSRGVV